MPAGAGQPRFRPRVAGQLAGRARPAGGRDPVEDRKEGSHAVLIARAPLRISLAGGGTDLAAYYQPFGGAVLSATIDKYFYVIITPTEGRHIQVSSSDYRTFFR